MEQSRDITDKKEKKKEKKRRKEKKRQKSSHANFFEYKNAVPHSCRVDFILSGGKWLINLP